MNTFLLFLCVCTAILFFMFSISSKEITEKAVDLERREVEFIDFKMTKCPYCNGEELSVMKINAYLNLEGFGKLPIILMTCDNCANITLFSHKMIKTKLEKE